MEFQRINKYCEQSLEGDYLVSASKVERGWLFAAYGPADMPGISYFKWHAQACSKIQWGPVIHEGRSGLAADIDQEQEKAQAWRAGQDQAEAQALEISQDQAEAQALEISQDQAEAQAETQAQEAQEGQEPVLEAKEAQEAQEGQEEAQEGLEADTGAAQRLVEYVPMRRNRLGMFWRVEEARAACDDHWKDNQQF